MGEADGQTVTESALFALPTEIRDRIRRVESEIRKAAQQGLDTEQLYDLLAGRKGLWRPDRESVHQDIVNGFLSATANVPSDRQAIIVGGLGGAGKTTVLTSELSQTFGVDVDDHGRISNFMIVNPDDAKVTLLERDLGPHVDNLEPMETSALVHEESSKIAHDLAVQAAVIGRNIIWDITLSNRDSAAQRIDELRDLGYSIAGVFVDVSVERAVHAALERYNKGVEEYENLGQGLGEGTCLRI